MAKKLRIDKALYWYLRHGLRTALDLWWRCDMGLWWSLGLEWDIARMDCNEEDAY